MPEPKSSPGPERPTHPTIWWAAIICAIVAIAVIFGGIVLFVGYMVIHPRVFINIGYAHLDAWKVDPAGQLQIQLTFVLHAENDNRRAHTKFSNTLLFVAFSGLNLATLEANPIDVRKNDSADIKYVVQEASIPLDHKMMQIVDHSMRRDRITLELKGTSRAQWRVWFLGSAKVWCRLNCQLDFHYRNGTYIAPHCSTKAQ